MTTADRKPPECEHCEATMAHDARVPYGGWYCVNCDRTPEEAINNRDDEDREERDRQWERGREEGWPW